MSANETYASRARAPGHESSWVLFGGVLIGAVALFVTGVQPVVLGGLADVGRLTEAGVGQGVMVELVGIAAGSSIGAFAMNGRMRIKAIAASAILALLNLAVYRHPSVAQFMVERGAAGLIEGLLLGVTSRLLTHTQRPIRWSAIFMTISQVPQILGGYLMPSLVIPRYGIDACFLVLAVSAGVALIASAAIVDRVDAPTEAAHTRIPFTTPLALFLMAVLLQNICMGCLWGYVEQLAHQRHFAPEIVGIAIGGGLASMGIGSTIAAIIAERVAPLKVLTLSGIVQMLCTLGLVLSTTAAGFIAALLTIGLFWTSTIPFAVGESIALDPSRRIALLNSPLNLIGQGVGPLLVSFFVEKDDLGVVYWFSATLFAAAAALYVMVSLSRGRVRFPV